MIDLSLSEFFAGAVILVVVLAAIGVAWDRLHERGAASAVRRRLIRCRICAAVFRDEGGEPVKPCPHCGSQNRSGRDRRLG